MRDSSGTISTALYIQAPHDNIGVHWNGKLVSSYVTTPITNSDGMEQYNKDDPKIHS